MNWTNFETTGSNNYTSQPAYPFRIYDDSCVFGLYGFGDNIFEKYAAELDSLKSEFDKILTSRVCPTGSNLNIEQEFWVFAEDNHNMYLLIERIKRCILWRSGSYECKMNMFTKRPNKTYSFKFMIDIDDNAERVLHENATLTIAGYLGANIKFRDTYVSAHSFEKIS